MGLGHLVFAEEFIRGIKPELQELINGFIKRGKILGEAFDKDLCIHQMYLSHPDFNGNSREDTYTLVFKIRVRKGHNREYYISKLEKYGEGVRAKVETVKVYV